MPRSSDDSGDERRRKRKSSPRERSRSRDRKNRHRDERKRSNSRERPTDRWPKDGYKELQRDNFHRDQNRDQHRDQHRNQHRDQRDFQGRSNHQSEEFMEHRRSQREEICERGVPEVRIYCANIQSLKLFIRALKFKNILYLPAFLARK